MNNNYLKVYKNKKVLITGSTGFKGAWLAFWLYKLGSRIVGIGLKPKKEDVAFKALKIIKKIKQYYIDINNFKKTNIIFKKFKPDIVFHLAAQSVVSKGYSLPIETFKTNIIGGANILDICKKNKIKNLVFITSDKCYENKKNKSFLESDKLNGDEPYSASKAAAEIIFHSYVKSFSINKNVLKYATGRAGNVTGGGDFRKNGIIPDIVRSIQNKQNLIIRNPSYTRPWQHVLDALNGYLKLGSFLVRNKLNKKLYPSWNFGPKLTKKISVLHLTKKFLKNWNIRKKINISKKNYFKESKFLRLNTQKARRELKWKTVLDIDENIFFTAEWYKKFYEKKNIEKLTNSQINYFTKKL